MTTEKPPLDWSKPLQTTDGVKAELRYTLKGSNYYHNRVVAVGDKDVLLDESGGQGYLDIQLINTPETKLVEFSVNCYEFHTVSWQSKHKADTMECNRTNRIDFSMRLESGKNYEVTGVKEVQ